MATIGKIGNNIIVQSDINTRPAVFSNWTNAKVTYKGDNSIGGPVVLYLGAQHGYCFSSNPVDYDGVLTEVNGIDVTAFTPSEIQSLIATAVLTDDKYSGTETIIDDTNLHVGKFTAIQIDEDAVFDVTPATGTVLLGSDGTPTDISGWSGVTFMAGTIKYGNYFSQIKLVSGKVTGYSNQ